MLARAYARIATSAAVTVALSNLVTSSEYTREDGFGIQEPMIFIPLAVLKGVGVGVSWPLLLPYLVYRHFDGVPSTRRDGRILVKNTGDIRWMLFLFGADLNGSAALHAKRLGLIEPVPQPPAAADN